MGDSFRVLVRDANRPGWSRPVSSATNLVRLCVRAGTEDAVLDLPPLVDSDAKDLARLALGDHFRVHQPGDLSLDMGEPRSCILQLAVPQPDRIVQVSGGRLSDPERRPCRLQLTSEAIDLRGRVIMQVPIDPPLLRGRAWPGRALCPARPLPQRRGALAQPIDQLLTLHRSRSCLAVESRHV